jgi:hypothetical protein
MSLRTEIYTHLINDTTVTDLVGVNIFHGLAPVNFDLSNDFLVYSTEQLENQNTLDVKSWGSLNIINIKAISQDSERMETIFLAVQKSVEAYSSSNVADILYLRNNYLYDEDNKVHLLSFDFESWYCN